MSGLVKDLCLVAQSYLTLCDPNGPQPTRFLCPWNFPVKNTGTGCHFLLQGIFLIQEQNLHWQVDSLPLNDLGNPTLSFRQKSDYQFRVCFRKSESRMGSTWSKSPSFLLMILASYMFIHYGPASCAFLKNRVHF